MNIFSKKRGGGRISPYNVSGLIAVLVLIPILFLLSDDVRGAAISLSCALIHESGHFAAILWFGGGIKRINVYPFGAEIEQDVSIVSDRAEICILFAGISFNLISAALAFASSAVFKIRFPQSFVRANLCYALLNALPIKTLDGGRVAEKLLTSRFSLKKAEKVLSLVSACLLLILFEFAALIFYYTSSNFTLLFFCLYLFYHTSVLTY